MTFYQDTRLWSLLVCKPWCKHQAVFVSLLDRLRVAEDLYLTSHSCSFGSTGLLTLQCFISLTSTNKHDTNIGAELVFHHFDLRLMEVEYIPRPQYFLSCSNVYILYTVPTYHNNSSEWTLLPLFEMKCNFSIFFLLSCCYSVEIACRNFFIIAQLSSGPTAFRLKASAQHSCRTMWCNLYSTQHCRQPFRPTLSYEHRSNKPLFTPLSCVVSWAVVSVHW